MLNLIQEAGVFGPLAIVVFLAGAGAVAFKRWSATPWAIALLGVGMAGHGMAARVVAKAAEGAENLPTKVTLLAVGSAEAGAAPIIAGLLAALLVATAAVLESARKTNAMVE
jgi:hypothetical protein